MGNAFAGSAASALDASTVWWNPAGMGFVKNPYGDNGDTVHRLQAVQVLNFMRTGNDFDNGASSPALGQPLGVEGGDAGAKRIVPLLYGQYKINETLFVGAGLNAPFGLRTVYDGNWMGRFQAQKSSSQTHNLNLAAAYKVTPQLSIGAGFNAQQFSAKLTNAVNYSAAVVAAGAPAALLDPTLPGTIAGLEGTARLKGDDVGFGWNFGVLFRPSDMLSLGAHYRSKIRYTIEGDVQFTPPSTANPVAAPIIAGLSAAGGPLASGPVSARLTVPDSLSMSAVIGSLESGPRTQLLLDATWMGWNTLDTVVFRRSNGVELSRLDFQWRDTWRLAAGVTHRIAQHVDVRVGYAWDQTAVDSERTRSPRLPDATRHWFSIGSRYAYSKKLTIDAALNYVKANDARIPNRADPNAAAGGVLDGTFKTNSLTLSLQAAAAFE